jgi:hypothetical protein
MADPGVHVPPIRLFTMFRSARSRSAEIRNLDLIWAVAIVAAGGFTLFT